MAKENDKDSARRAIRVDAVRSAVDQAFQATAGQGAAAAESGRERAQDIVDQLTQAAGRVREVLDELRPPTADELRALRRAVADLEQRVAALEQTQETPKRTKAAPKRAAAKGQAQTKPKPARKPARKSS
jgi:polyhydroxyalkanoate synthesis regulator phasin